MLGEVQLHDGTPRDGNFGVLIRGDEAFVSDPDRTSTIRMYDLRAFGKAMPEVLATTATPDGLPWSPVRVAAMR
jgi:hypothetical protein